MDSAAAALHNGFMLEGRRVVGEMIPTSFDSRHPAT